MNDLMSDAASALFFHSVFPVAVLVGWGTVFHYFDFTQFFQVISALGSALTAYKLYHAGLHRRYRFFFAYLIFRVPCISCALFMDQRGKTYLWLFTKSEPIVMLFYVLIVLELYRLVLERYKGLYTLGRWVMGAAMAIAVGISIISLRGVATAQLQRFSGWVVFELKAEARLDLALVLFILLIIWFLSRYPIRLNRNVVVHTIVYSVFFFANSLGLVFWLFKIRIFEPFNTILMGIASACAVAWWIGLTRKGEEVQVHLPSLGPGAEQRALQQLAALNATLLKASQK
ncbi:MAG: hypothetical protein ABSH40_10005 [Bryobacteraceae bacterium]